jgi:polysaccharide biosynthesis protein PelF
MNEDVDVCLLVEGGYPYVLGGLAAWTDGLIRSLPKLSFHVVAITISSVEHEVRYPPPDNLRGVTKLVLDRPPTGGRIPDKNFVIQFCEQFSAIITSDNGAEFSMLMRAFEQAQPDASSLLQSRDAWSAMIAAERSTLQTLPFLDFFWAWRFLAQSVISVAALPLPRARIYHAVSTGYAGLLGARAKSVTDRPFIVTEHGIYTNERRIEIAIADWIFESSASGFGVENRKMQLRDFWLGAFENFSRIAYNLSDAITTQFEANQMLQKFEGAPDQKLRIIRNGIEIDDYLGVVPDGEQRPPRVVLIGRVVPIKDIGTFILAISLLRKFVPDVEAVIIGPADEDPRYASECGKIAAQHGVQSILKFAGRVPDIKYFLARSDVFVLTSLSEAQPLSLLEAGAAGLPAVVTDVGSCREILEGATDEVDPQPGGIVTATGDAPAIAQAIAKILLDPSMKQRMGLALRRRVRAYYDSRKSATMYAELYDFHL